MRTIVFCVKNQTYVYSKLIVVFLMFNQYLKKLVAIGLT